VSEGSQVTHFEILRSHPPGRLAQDDGDRCDAHALSKLGHWAGVPASRRQNGRRGRRHHMSSDWTLDCRKLLGIELTSNEISG